MNYLTFLYFQDEVPDHRLADVSTLLKYLGEFGFTASPFDVYQAWDAYSDSLCAGWINLKDDPEENVQILRRYMVEAGR